MVHQSNTPEGEKKLNESNVRDTFAKEFILDSLKSKKNRHNSILHFNNILDWKYPYDNSMGLLEWMKNFKERVEKDKVSWTNDLKRYHDLVDFDFSTLTEKHIIDYSKKINAELVKSREIISDVVLESHINLTKKERSALDNIIRDSSKESLDKFISSPALLFSKVIWKTRAKDEFAVVNFYNDRKVPKNVRDAFQILEASIPTFTKDFIDAYQKNPHPSVVSDYLLNTFSSVTSLWEEAKIHILDFFWYKTIELWSLPSAISDEIKRNFLKEYIEQIYKTAEDDGVEIVSSVKTKIKNIRTSSQSIEDKVKNINSAVFTAISTVPTSRPLIDFYPPLKDSYKIRTRDLIPFLSWTHPLKVDDIFQKSTSPNPLDANIIDTNLAYLIKEDFDFNSSKYDNTNNPGQIFYGVPNKSNRDIVEYKNIYSPTNEKDAWVILYNLLETWGYSAISTNSFESIKSWYFYLEDATGKYIYHFTKQSKNSKDVDYIKYEAPNWNNYNLSDLENLNEVAKYSNFQNCLEDILWWKSVLDRNEFDAHFTSTKISWINPNLQSNLDIPTWDIVKSDRSLDTSSLNLNFASAQELLDFLPVIFDKVAKWFWVENVEVPLLKDISILDKIINKNKKWFLSIEDSGQGKYSFVKYDENWTFVESKDASDIWFFVEYIFWDLKDPLSFSIEDYLSNIEVESPSIAQDIEKIKDAEANIILWDPDLYDSLSSTISAESKNKIQANWYKDDFYDILEDIRNNNLISDGARMAAIKRLIEKQVELDKTKDAFKVREIKALSTFKLIDSYVNKIGIEGAKNFSDILYPYQATTIERDKNPKARGESQDDYDDRIDSIVESKYSLAWVSYFESWWQLFKVNWFKESALRNDFLRLKVVALWPKDNPNFWKESYTYYGVKSFLQIFEQSKGSAKFLSQDDIEEIKINRDSLNIDMDYNSVSSLDALKKIKKRIEEQVAASNLASDEYDEVLSPQDHPQLWLLYKNVSDRIDNLQNIWKTQDELLDISEKILFEETDLYNKGYTREENPDRFEELDKLIWDKEALDSKYDNLSTVEFDNFLSDINRLDSAWAKYGFWAWVNILVKDEDSNSMVYTVERVFKHNTDNENPSAWIEIWTPYAVISISPTQKIEVPLYMIEEFFSKTKAKRISKTSNVTDMLSLLKSDKKTKDDFENVEIFWNKFISTNFPAWDDDSSKERAKKQEIKFFHWEFKWKSTIINVLNIDRQAWTVSVKIWDHIAWKKQKHWEKELSDEEKRDKIILSQKEQEISIAHFHYLMKEGKFWVYDHISREEWIDQPDVEDNELGSNPFKMWFKIAVTIPELINWLNLPIEAFKKSTEAASSYNEAKVWAFAWRIMSLWSDDVYTTLIQEKESKEREMADSIMDRLKVINSKTATEKIRRWMLDKSTAETKKEAAIKFLFEKYGQLYAKRPLYKYQWTFLFYRAFGWKVWDKFFNDFKKSCEDKKIPFSEEDLLFKFISKQCNDPNHPRRSKYYKELRWCLPTGINDEMEKWKRESWEERVWKNIDDQILWECESWNYPMAIWLIRWLFDRWASLATMNRWLFLMSFSWASSRFTSHLTNEVKKLCWEGRISPYAACMSYPEHNKVLNETIVEVSKIMQEEHWVSWMYDSALSIFNAMTRKTKTEIDLIKECTKFFDKYWDRLTNALYKINKSWSWTENTDQIIDFHSQDIKDEDWRIISRGRPVFVKYQEILTWMAWNTTHDSEFFTDAFEHVWMNIMPDRMIKQSISLTWHWTLAPNKWDIEFPQSVLEPMFEYLRNLKTIKFDWDDKKALAQRKRAYVHIVKDHVAPLLELAWTTEVIWAMSSSKWHFWWFRDAWIHLYWDFSRNWYKPNDIRSGVADAYIEQMADDFFAWRDRYPDIPDFENSYAAAKGLKEYFSETTSDTQIWRRINGIVWWGDDPSEMATR